MSTATRTVCRPDQHDFVPKRQKTTVEAHDQQVMDISEVFCRKCGTVCFLTTQEPAAEPSRIKVVSDRRVFEPTDFGHEWPLS